MLVNISNETFNVADGTYTATILSVKEYQPDDNGKFSKVIMKLELNTGEILVKFYNRDDLEKLPWSSLFKALNTYDTDDLVDKTIELVVKNNTSKSSGTVFSNIKRVKLKES